jgi:hypothetical protein
MMRKTLWVVGLSLVLPACVSTTYHQLRPGVYGPHDAVEFYCGNVSNDAEITTKRVQAAYGKGWRVVALGHTVTSFLGLQLTSEPVFCAERIKQP